MLTELLEIAQTLTPDEFPGKIRDVATKCGIPDAVSLMQHVPGLEIYVPTAKKKVVLHQYIKSNYDGSNALSIAVKTNMNSAKVKAIAKGCSTLTDPLATVQMKMVAVECGQDVANRLLDEFPGERILVPTDSNFLKRKYICKFFNGSNGADLAIRLCVHERFIRKVVSEMYEEQRNPQLSLFE